GNLLWSADLSFLQDKYGAQTSNGAPALEDIDVDGDIEIIVPTQSGAVMVFDHNGNLVWTYATDDAISSTPVVANFDPDNPGVEILFGSGDTYLYVLDRNGELLWRRSTGWIIRGSPMLLDTDGDGFPEVFIGGEDKKVHAFHYWAETVEGWPQETEGAIISSPISGDIDEDGDQEILVSAEDGKLYAWHTDGTAVNDWPKQTGVTYKGSPVVMNADSDPADEVFAADFGGSLVIIGAAQNDQLQQGTSIYIPFVTR
ncbi:MAG: FG-GAP-like repeat-containing protein, partial [Chloroflexota bacterium]